MTTKAPVSCGWLKIESVCYIGVMYGYKMADGSNQQLWRAETPEAAKAAAEALAVEKGLECRPLETLRTKARNQAERAARSAEKAAAETQKTPEGAMWIAAAYDSDDGFALGESAEAAMMAYTEKFGEPRYGYSVIDDRASYKRELERIGVAMGYAEKSIPLFRTGEWITVSPLGEGAAELLEGKKSSSFLVADWSRDDGKFFIVAPRRAA